MKTFALAFVRRVELVALIVGGFTIGVFCAAIGMGAHALLSKAVGQ